MNESTIAQQLAVELNDNTLVVQVVFAAPYIQVVINRTQLPPDYPALSQRIAEILGQMDLPNMQYVAVYGRVYGQEDTEYEVSLEIIKTPVAASPPVMPSDNPFLSAAASVPVEPEKPVFRLSDYCFTRNQALLTADLPSPKIAIAELIRDFDSFPDPEKQLILEQFSAFLRNPDGVNTQNWSPEMRTWLGRIRTFSDEESRSLAIWMSRYCAHPEATLETVRGVIQAEKAAAKERARQEREARLAEREARATAGGRGQSPVATRPERATGVSRTAPPPRRRSPVAKVFALLGLMVATVASTWFFRGFTLALGWFGTILFIFGFLGGWFSGLTKANEGLIIGRMSTAALVTYLILGIVLLPIAIIIYFLLAFFMGFLVIPYVSAIAGGIVGVLGRWFLQGFGENEEAEGVKYGSFYGLSVNLLWLTLLAHLAGILLGGLPGFDSLNFGGNEQRLAVIPDFSIEQCSLIERGMTVKQLEKGINAPPNRVAVTDGQAEYTWKYDNAEIAVVTEQKIDEEAVIQEVIFDSNQSPEALMQKLERKGIFSRDKKIIFVDKCLVCTTGEFSRSCTNQP